jgi:hypothetical protein
MSWNSYIGDLYADLVWQFIRLMAIYKLKQPRESVQPKKIAEIVAK